MFFGVRDLLAAAHTRSMEDRAHELPRATARPRSLRGWMTASLGGVRRLLGRARAALRGRHVVLLLTGVFFSAMMVCMGYVAERANRAADAIDEAQRAHMKPGRLVEKARAAQAKAKAEADVLWIDRER